MANLQHSLAFLYSGGAGNEDPLLSLGGLASTAPGRRVDSQNFTASTIAGVALVFATRNPTGSGTLAYSATNRTLSWTPAGGSTYTAAISRSGLISVGSVSSGFVQADIVEANLPGTDASCSITVSSLLGTLFGDHPSSAKTAGITEYRCIYLKNEGPYQIEALQLSVSVVGSFSTLSLGSEILPYSVLSANLKALRGFRTFGPFTGYPPMSFDDRPGSEREDLVFTYLDGTPVYTPYVTSGSLYSDGATYSLPSVIADRTDSGGVLDAIRWQSTLRWPVLPAGTSLWFWIKKVTTPYGASTETETMHLDADMTN